VERRAVDLGDETGGAPREVHLSDPALGVAEIELARWPAKALSIARSARRACTSPQRSKTVRATEVQGIPSTVRQW
jgi:hypothetical protein